MRLSTLSNAGRSFSQKPPVSNSMSPSEVQTQQDEVQTQDLLKTLQLELQLERRKRHESELELQLELQLERRKRHESELELQLELQLERQKRQKMLQSNLDRLVDDLSKINVKGVRDGMSLTVNNITGHALCKCDFETNAMQAEFSFPTPFVSETVLQAAKELKHVHAQGNTYHFEWDDDGWTAFATDFTSLLNLCWFDTRDASKSVYGLLKLRQSKSEPPISQFPVGMHMLLEAIRPQLRPFPTNLVPTLDGEIVFTNKRGEPIETGLSDSVNTPIIFHDGVSGKGKTITATTLSDETLRRVAGSDFQGAPVLGYYVCSSISNNLEELARKAGEHFVHLYKDGCPSPTNFGPVILHVVLDELGSKRDWVGSLLGNGRVEVKITKDVVAACEKHRDSVSVFDFAGKITNQLDKWFQNATVGDRQRKCRISVILSLVGTGIERTNSANSLPPQYLVCNLRGNLSQSIFAHHMLMGGQSTALWLTAAMAKDIAARLSKNSLFGAIMSNARCAVFAGEEAGVALRFFRGSKAAAKKKINATADEIDQLTINEVIPYLVGHSESILTRASMRYFRENGWFKLQSSEKETLVISVISLLITQPYGFHLLSDATIDALCCNVGAIEDTLQFVPTPTTNPEHPLAHRALSAGAFPCVPSGNNTTLYPKVGAHRFVIPPAIAVAVLLEAVSIHFNGVLFGGTRQLASLTYENVTSTVIWCALEAVRVFSTRGEKNTVVKVPALLAFPSIADHLEGTGAAMKQVKLAMHGGDEIELLPPSDMDADTRIREVTRLLAECGMVLEMAGPGSPRNDLTLHNPGGASIAFEFKSYTDSTSVPISTLEKRCFHMGFDTLHCKSDVGSFDKDAKQHKSGSNLLGRYITLSADCKETDEYLVLCGPRGSHLLPNNTSITFRDRVKFKTDTHSVEPSPGRRCTVVCMTLGVEQLIHQCSSWHNVDAATSTEQPTETVKRQVGFETKDGVIVLENKETNPPFYAPDNATNVLQIHNDTNLDGIGGTLVKKGHFSYLFFKSVGDCTTQLKVLRTRKQICKYGFSTTLRIEGGNEHDIRKICGRELIESLENKEGGLLVNLKSPKVALPFYRRLRRDLPSSTVTFEPWQELTASFAL